MNLIAEYIYIYIVSNQKKQKLRIFFYNKPNLGSTFLYYYNFIMVCYFFYYTSCFFRWIMNYFIMKKKLFFMCRCNDACVFLLSFKFFSVSKENKNFSQRTFHYSSIRFNILVIFLCRGCCCFYCSFIIIFSKFIV